MSLSLSFVIREGKVLGVADGDRDGEAFFAARAAAIINIALADREPNASAGFATPLPLPVPLPFVLSFGPFLFLLLFPCERVILQAAEQTEPCERRNERNDADRFLAESRSYRVGLQAVIRVGWCSRTHTRQLKLRGAALAPAESTSVV